MVWKLTAGILLVLLVAFGLFGLSSYFITELWWFHVLGYKDVFRTGVLWQWGFAVVLFLAGALFVGWNLWRARSVMGQIMAHSTI